MNENNITVISKPAQKKDVIELDLLDLLAELFLKWKRILAFLLIGAILGYGGALVKSGGKAEPVTEQALADARAKIASDKALAVEQLFFQYVSYKELQEDMRAYYRDFVASDVNLDNTVQMRSEYYIVSTGRNLDTVFERMTLTEADYQAMRAIAPDEEAGATIYDRVVLETAYNSNNVNVSLQDEKENVYLINVTLYGSSEEQCRELMAIVDEAFRRQVKELKILDPDIRMDNLGEQFNYNVADHVYYLRKRNIDQMTTSEYELNNLNTNVQKLSREEKNYYNLLMQRYDEAFAVEEHVSWKKWTVIGAFLGAVIAVGVMALGYVLDGSVKSEYELEQGGKVLSRVFVQGKKNLFGKWAAGLIHADDTDPAVKADMVAANISILMEKNGKNTLLLLCSQENEDAARFAEQVKSRIEAKNGSLKVDIGNPLCSIKELEMAARADMGVAFVEMKKSKRTMLREWEQICEGYKLPLTYSVAVRRTW